MYITRNQLAGTGIAALLLVAAVVIKLVWYPSVDEKYFLLDYQKLEKAPAHVLILRPTHFPLSRRAGAFMALFPTKANRPDSNVPRGVGRNASLSELFAAAYQCSASKIVLPPLATTNRFDFLVTVTRQPVEQFRAAIRHKLGYVASWQQRDAEVLVLKVQGSGPTPSTADRQSANFNNGRLYFQHTSVPQIIGMAQNIFKQPLVDRTGLTGFYDFNIPWQGRNNADEQAARKAFADMGFTVDSGTEPLQMLVVEDAK